VIDLRVAAIGFSPLTHRALRGKSRRAAHRFALKNRTRPNTTVVES
jgi:hypothetical protein